MDKKELLELLKEKVGFETKKEAGEFIDKIDLAFKSIAETLEVDEKVKVGQYFTLEKKHVEGKTGVALGREYSTPAHDEIKIKKTSLMKNLV